MDPTEALIRGVELGVFGVTHLGINAVRDVRGPNNLLLYLEHVASYATRPLFFHGIMPYPNMEGALWLAGVASIVMGVVGDGFIPVLRDHESAQWDQIACDLVGVGLFVLGTSLLAK